MTERLDICDIASRTRGAAAPAEEAPCLPVGLKPSRRDRLDREARYLINEAFHQPSAGIAYYVSQRIAELFPQKALVECRGYDFDPVRFASAGQCRMHMKNPPYPHWILDWEESADSLGKIENRLWQGWFEIEWQDEQLEVLMMHWDGEYDDLRHCFILAGTRELAVRFLRTVCAWNAQPRGELLVFDGDDWEKDEELYRAIKGARLDNLVLPGTMKEDLLADASGFFAAQDTYRRYGVPWKRGILFTGPPGNGKTHAVKALVNTLPQRCLYVKGFRGRRGPDERGIASVFAKARRCAPCILVLEDLDSLVTEQNRSFFLNELDGFAGNNGILTVATSNHPEKLDPAISDRPSRFDRKYRFDLPGIEERGAYLQQWNASLEAEMRIEEEVVRQAAERTEGFSFAYLKELCLSALMAWVQTSQPGGMAAALRGQVDVLREQMGSKREKR